MAGELIRTFIAIEIPCDVKTALMELQEDIQSQLPKRLMRWVPPKDIHLTLRYVGEIASDQAHALIPILSGIAHRSAPFNLSLGGLGCFPRAQTPRVIWVGVMGDLDRLQNIWSAVQQGAQRIGHHPHHPEKLNFSPHLTLGRVRRHVSHREVRAVGSQIPCRQ